MDIIQLTKKLGGKIEVRSKKKLTKKILPILYTPGVAKISTAIVKNKSLSFEYTIRKNSVAVISDGSAVLGLGNLGPEGALPVMEGKALLFKELGGVDAIPIVLATQKIKEIIEIIKAIAPTFGGINLEDISSPKCFEIEEKLKKDLDIPIFHDDQHGTAIIVLAGLINALKVVKKDIKNIKIAISGAGAAGIAITKIILKHGGRGENIILTDTEGIIYKGRKNRMNWAKQEIANFTNLKKIKGNLIKAIDQADVFIGVSAPNLLKSKDIKKMNKNAIVFAMSNPVPEILPEEARKGGATVIATGRSDYPNQINNVLVFPGIFRGVLDAKIKKITDKHKLAAAKAIANCIKKPTANKLIPSALNKQVVKKVANVFKYNHNS